jgi:hypothetical protein
MPTVSTSLSTLSSAAGVLAKQLAAEKERQMGERNYQASCFSGHTQKMSRAEMVSLFGKDLIAQIDSGEVLSAPILPLGECYECSVQKKRTDRLDQEMLLGI